MPDSRIPKQLLYSQLSDTKHHDGGQRKRYKDQLHVNFKSCNLDHTKWETLDEDRYAWREECYNAVNGFEEQRIDAAKVRRAARIVITQFPQPPPYTVTHLTRVDGPVPSSIGLFSHKRNHR